MKTLYLDCFSGISGNMFVGMFLQAGIPFDELKETFSGIRLDGYSLICESVNKMGIQAVYYNVCLVHEAKYYSHYDHVHSYNVGIRHFLARLCGHKHDHHHVHRRLKDIRAVIETASLSVQVKEKSLAVFRVLAEAEGKVHGMPPEEVHFHEVGAVDCILDIVGTVWALERLGIEQIGISPLHVGSGFVQCAHGRMPVPAPATAELLAGLPFYSGSIGGELVTPTGAALVRVLATYAGPRPEGFVHEKVAYGAGTKDLSIPNVLRGYIGTGKAFNTV